MNSVLIDTNFYVAMMRGEAFARDIVHQSENIILCPIVLGELLFGFKNGDHERRNLEQLRNLLNRPSIKTIEITIKTSEFFALITSQLKKSGTPIPTNDIWIASCAMEHGLTLATRDAHFKKITNLLLV